MVGFQLAQRDTLLPHHQCPRNLCFYDPWQGVNDVISKPLIPMTSHQFRPLLEYCVEAVSQEEHRHA